MTSNLDSRILKHNCRTIDRVFRRGGTGKIILPDPDGQTWRTVEIDQTDATFFIADYIDLEYERVLKERTDGKWLSDGDYVFFSHVQQHGTIGFQFVHMKGLGTYALPVNSLLSCSGGQPQWIRVPEATIGTTAYDDLLVQDRWDCSLCFSHARKYLPKAIGKPGAGIFRSLVELDARFEADLAEEDGSDV